MLVSYERIAVIMFASSAAGETADASSAPCFICPAPNALAVAPVFVKRFAPALRRSRVVVEPHDVHLADRHAVAADDPVLRHREPVPRRHDDRLARPVREKRLAVRHRQAPRVVPAENAPARV